jgi:hypothetical protein
MATDPEVKPLTLVLTPIQLAAILRGESIPEPATVGNSLLGLLGVVGGTAELVAAAALLMTPEPTTASKIAGVAMGAHGLDTAQAGLRQAWSGQTTHTVTSDTVTAGAQLAGLDPATARLAGSLADLCVPIGVATSLRVARLMSVRAGVIATVDETAAAWQQTLKTNAEILQESEKMVASAEFGGHTILKHVSQKNAAMIERLLKGGQDAITTFRTLEQAAVWICKGLRVNASQITFWSQTAREGQTLEIVFDAGTVIGHGIARFGPFGIKTIQATRMTIVLIKDSRAAKTFYILTAYPIP